MARIVTVLLLVLLVSSAAMAQGVQWQFMGLFPKAGVAPGDTVWPADVHGMAVSPDGKIWIQKLGTFPRDTMVITNYMNDKDPKPAPDSIITRTVAVRALYAYNPDGTQAPFSPIKVVQINGKADTIGGASMMVNGSLVWDPVNSPNTGRGLRPGHQGNIIATYFSYLYRINYQTGAGMGKVDATNLASGVAVGVDSLGYIYANRVSASNTPLKVFDKDFNFIQNAVDTLTGFSRALEVSKDGMDIYFADYTKHAIKNYKSTDNGLTWGQCDTVLKGMDVESMGWNPKTGYLYASAGSYNDTPNRWPGLTTMYTRGTWYGVDTKTMTIKDSILWVHYGVTDAQRSGERPRAIAFSPSGDTVYVGVFGGSAPTPGVRMYKRTITGLEQKDNAVPETYTLSQNYPNPFNPTTEISFTIPHSGMTTLAVYDMLGREVATLVNENLGAGTYKYGFNATRLSSGTYIYTLTSGNARITKKMMLVK